MFNLFKKKKKQENIEEPKKDKSKKKKKGLPTESDKFREIYMKSEPYIPLASTDELLGLSGEFNQSIRTNDVLIVNDTHRKMIENIIIPMVSQGNLSYVIYDPSGEIYGKTESIFRKNNYDIRVVDFCDASIGSTDRIDFFEMVNINQRTEELARIIANCFDTLLMQQISFTLLVAVFEYILFVGSTLSSKRVRWVFDQIKDNNKEIISSIEKCPKAGAALRHNIKGMTRGNIIKVVDKLDNEIIPVMEKYGVNPTIFSVLTMKRNVAIFVKEVSEESNYIATAMIYNLMSLSSITGEDKELNTIIFDNGTDNWYNRAEIKRWRKQADYINGECTSIVYIRETMSDEMMKDFIPALTLFVSSTNQPTIDWAYDSIKRQYLVANGVEDKEDLDIGLTRFDLEAMQDVVIFANTEDPNLTFSPIKAKLIQVNDPPLNRLRSV